MSEQLKRLVVALVEGRYPSADYKSAEDKKEICELKNDTFVLGWHRYATFNFEDDGFTGITVYDCNTSNFENKIFSSKFNKIVTCGISSCTVVIMKSGNRYCFAHLDRSDIMERNAIGDMCGKFGCDPEHVFISYMNDEYLKKIQKALNTNLRNTQFIDRRIYKTEKETCAGHSKIELNINNEIRTDVSSFMHKMIAVPEAWNLCFEVNTQDVITKAAYYTFEEARDYLNEIADIWGLEKI